VGTVLSSRPSAGTPCRRQRRGGTVMGTITTTEADTINADLLAFIRA
jgi:hypothetical protein